MGDFTHNRMFIYCIRRVNFQNHKKEEGNILL